MRETGQIAYEAFCVKRGWGTGSVPWAQLDKTIKDAWRHAAHEVIQKGWYERDETETGGNNPAGPDVRPSANWRESPLRDHDYQRRAAETRPRSMGSQDGRRTRSEKLGGPDQHGPRDPHRPD